MKEIQSVKRFVSARSKLGNADSNMTQMMDSLANKLKKLIANHNIASSSDVSTIMLELSDSPYGQEHTRSIIQVLEQNMLDASAAQTNNPNTPRDEIIGKSKLQHWWNYFTNSDWVVLNSGKSWYTITELAVHRARSFGCVDPDEQSVKWLLALLIAIHYRDSNMPSALQKYRKFNDLKLMFETAIANTDKLPPSLTCYPQDPSDLPTEMQACYQDDPAVNKDKSSDVCAVANIAKLVPMRRNSALLKCVPSHEFDVTPRIKHTPAQQRFSGSSTSPCSKSDSFMHESPEVEPSPVKAELKHHNFCPSCGHNLCGAHSHGAAPVKLGASPVKLEPVQDAAAAIKEKLRINGVSMLALPAKLELPNPATKPDAAEVQPPTLDPIAQAAIEALRTRRELKRADDAAKKAKTAKTLAQEQHDDQYAEDEDEGDADDDDDDDDDDHVYVAKKPSAQKKHAMKKKCRVVAKKPAMNSAGDRHGCLKCRGLGPCIQCKKLTFKGKRVTRAEWLKLMLK